MRTLIAVVNCQSRELYAHSVRVTWKRDCPDDVKFFLGGQSRLRTPRADEVFVDAPDDYNSLPFKIRGMMQWTLEQGYDRVLKIDDDMLYFYSRIPEIKGDYAGFRVNPGRENYCAGPAYWLTRKAMEVIAGATPPPGPAEDRWVGAILEKAGILSVDAPGIQLFGKRRPLPNNIRELVNRSWAIGEFRPDEFRGAYRWW